MWKASQRLFLRKSSWHHRYCYLSTKSSSSSRKEPSLATEAKGTFKLPDAILPSIQFLEHLNQGQQAKVARMMVELEAIYSVCNEVPTKMNEDQWKYMLKNTYQIYDRQEYLRKLHFDELNTERLRQIAEQRQQLLQEQTERFDRGEIIYDKGFNELYAIRGADFRRLIDCSYGSRLWTKEKFDNGLPQFFVDCRFLGKLNHTWLSRVLNDFQQLHLKNWQDWNPVHIAFSNYLADERVAQESKKHLKFYYGPQPKTTGDTQFLDDDAELFGDQQQENALVPTPFAPHLTHRDFCSILPENVKRNEIAYVSRLGHKLLDDEVIKRTKVFAVHAFPEHVLQKPERLQLLKSLNKEDIEVYQLPMSTYVDCLDNQKYLNASVTTSILRDLLSNNLNWKQAIMNNLSSYHFTNPDSENGKIKQKRVQQGIETFISQNWDADQRQKRVLESKSNAEPVQKEPRKYVHRYTREERNQKRKAANESV